MRVRPHCLIVSLLLIVTLATWNSITSIKGSRAARASELTGKQPGDPDDVTSSESDNPEQVVTSGSAFRFLQNKLYKKIMGGDESVRERGRGGGDGKKERGGSVKKMGVEGNKPPKKGSELKRRLGRVKPKKEKGGRKVIVPEDDNDDDAAGSEVAEKPKHPEGFDHKTIPEFVGDLSKEHQPMDNEDKHDKWIVVTTIAPPTNDVMFLANITGWRVVVVGDTKTPTDWSYPNCVYLSVSRQLELGLATPQLLPYKHYARKNVGYLYAIAHGAQVIYETDDDNRPLDKLYSFELGSSTSGLMYSSNSTTFNPYRHFGQPTLWPRGFPLSQIGAETKDVYKLSDKWGTPAIQQGVVNGDPDMDAIFRLTRKLTLKPLQVLFDPVAPPVILSPGIFSPFNSQNTLFLKNALWALLIPTTTTFRMCDIWRGYWAQRLLWEIGGTLGFYSPNAYQQRNAHNYMADMEDEKDMYFHTDRLVAYLSRWSCPDHMTFFQCVYKLTLDMAMEKFWMEKDVTITKHWLEDLIRVGYGEPKRLNHTWVRERINKIVTNPSSKIPKQIIESLSKVDSDVGRINALITIQGTAVSFVASDQTSPEVIPNRASGVSQTARQVDMIAKLCPSIPSYTVPTHFMRGSSPTYFNDVLLIVVFNWPFYANARISETIYRPLFKNIVYCGANAAQFALETASFSARGLTFVEAPRIQAGQFSPWCVVKAMQMNYRASGYLVTGDDVLLNVWNFRPFDKTKIWMTVERYLFDIRHPHANDWMWWNTPVGNQAYKNAIKSLTVVSQLDHNHHPDKPVNIDKVTPDSNDNSDNGTTTLENNVKDQQQQQQQQAPSNDTATSSNGYTRNKLFNQRTNKYKNALIPDAMAYRPSQFLAKLSANTGGEHMAIHAISDIYFIPARLKTDAIYYLTHFLAHNVFVELSVATAIYGLEDPANIQAFHGTNLWLEERNNPWARFNSKEFFLHPVKMSDQGHLGPLCTIYFPALLAHYHGSG